ncbi:MAG TPA: MerR family transcriptional regulator [Burkholderiales bacterium]|jgi:DNA-binding transcriptional MerR regulator|nr:MerR family transcriptional regulator [Burkholderiales bacterium]
MSLGVAEVARAAGVSPHTVRYYVARGLLRAKKDPRSGYHRFTDGDARTLTFVRRAQALGFTLREIETVIAMSRRHESPCPMVRDIVRRRVAEFTVQLAELDDTCRRMRGALRTWAGMPNSVPYGDEICRLIESVGTPLPLADSAREGSGVKARLTFERLEGRTSRTAGPRRRTRKT